MRPDNDKRWQTALTCVAGGFAGAWLGYMLYEAWDCLVARPELYAAYSAPWYTGPLLLAGPAALIVAAALAAKWWLRPQKEVSRGRVWLCRRRGGQRQPGAFAAAQAGDAPPEDRVQ